MARVYTFRVVNGELPVRLAREARQRMAKLRPVLAPFAARAQRLAKDRLTRGRDWDDAPFAELRPSTRREKRRLGFDPRPLIRTQFLRRGLEGEASDQAVQLQIVGRSQRYARFHLTGTKRMAARRFFPVAAGGEAGPGVLAGKLDFSGTSLGRRFLDDMLRAVATYVATGRRP